MSRWSLPEISGAASMHHMEKCARSSFIGQAVADFEHVGIVPMTRAGVGRATVFADREFAARRSDARCRGQATPSKLGPDVSRRAPEMADVLGPQPRLVVAPFAEAEDNRASGGVQRVAHGLVGFLGIGRAVFAPVVFQKVHAPRGVGERVLIFMAAPAGKAARRFWCRRNCGCRT